MNTVKSYTLVMGDEEIVIELDKNDSSAILSEYAKELKNSAGE